MLQGAALTGKISVLGSLLMAKVGGTGTLTGSLSKPIGYVDYKDSYEVTPKTTEQVLQTKDKHLTDDVTIKSIPYFDVSNTAGGSTVYIGNEV